LTRFVINQSVVDIWTTTHFLWGLFARGIRLPLWLTVVLATAFEVVESRLERMMPALFPDRKPDSYRNAAGDIAAVTAGWVALDLVLRLDVSRDT